MEWGALLIALVFGIVLGYLTVTLWRKRKPETCEEESWEEAWARETPTRDDKTPMEDRILNALKNQMNKWEDSMQFVTLRWECMVGDNQFDDKEFFETLQRLKREGKVVRVEGPTTTDSSKWALPEEGKCENTNG